MVPSTARRSIAAGVGFALVLLPALAFGRQRAVQTPAPTIAITTQYQRVPLDVIDRVPVGSKVEIVGYFSHKSEEVDGDLEVYLIDHRGHFAVVEAPHIFRGMKWEIRGHHFHRGDLVVARGPLTRQFDKPTTVYRAGWMEIMPVETIEFYRGELPPDLRYVRVNP